VRLSRHCRLAAVLALGAVCLAQDNAVTLKALIATAWNVKPFQIVGGPEWLHIDRWDVAPGPGLQARLTGRFGLAVHREIRRVPVFNLTLAKGGLKVAAVVCSASCGNIESRRGRVDATGTHMKEFADVLAGILNRPDIDKTGFAGTFDAHFDYLPDDAVDATGPDASIFVVLEERFGLKLESSRGPIEMLIVDRVIRP
jgi:uncharacterized protein (TIGR03435 family)